MKPAEYAKAIVGAALAALTALGTALADGEGISAGEWVGIAGAALATFGVVFGVPNADPLARGHRRTPVGQTNVVYLLVVALLAVLLVVVVVNVFGGAED